MSEHTEWESRMEKLELANKVLLEALREISFDEYVTAEGRACRDIAAVAIAKVEEA